ncbi:hemerythrin domain-containing protein [Streptomyces sp. LP11]|uniref:Hemerythrin domain-containing protein n=1 Tax=Streptomyces pyxinicus TaxID=2970331 RepID=A0ABT2AVY9_9ACTN|nr:hemerythrin domain-containing protein [Streptomyces sp. LP11]MCS0600397.1 hemerythrin domain-containing protein [Streptomyces sp. LP11]
MAPSTDSTDSTAAPGLPPADPGRPYTHEMVVVHRVFRRESALLPRLVRAVPAGDVARARTVAEYAEEYAHGLHHHHHLEDELIWPLLRERAGQSSASDALVARMEDQHGTIDTTLNQAAVLLTTWRETADPDTALRLADVLDTHRDALTEHLDDEERLVLPLVAEHLTVAEWDEVGRRGLETLPKNKVLLALGAILEDATPAERAYFLGRAPLAGRLLWRLVGRRQYASRCRALRAPLVA